MLQSCHYTTELYPALLSSSQQGLSLKSAPNSSFQNRLHSLVQQHVLYNQCLHTLNLEQVTVVFHYFHYHVYHCRLSTTMMASPNMATPTAHAPSPSSLSPTDYALTHAANRCFHQWTTYSTPDSEPGERTQLKVSFATTSNFNDPGADDMPTLFIHGPMVASRYFLAGYDYLARKVGVRVVLMDR